MQIRTKASRSDHVSSREKENLQVAYRAACESIVLLKNDGALPLTSKTVALFGPGVSMTIKGGTGSGEVNERHSVTILEGMEDRGFTVTSKDWIRRFENHYQEQYALYQEEKKKRVNLLKLDSIMSMLFDNFRFPDGPEVTEADVAEETDSCIYVLSRQAGEGGDRKVEAGDFLLTELEKQTIRFLAQRYEKFVLAINCGSAMDMSFLDQIPEINAVLYICQLGTEGGHAFADVISGAVTPSGKLSSTWAKQYSDVPFGAEYGSCNGNLKQEFYKEGIYVGYRYYDSFGVEPCYPFGYGLSYTDFEITPCEAQLDGTRVLLNVSVRNIGSQYSGKETVQLYVSAPNGAMDKEYQSLAAFAKTGLLAPGASENLKLSFDLKELASYREADGCYVLEKGGYLLRVGNSSRVTVPAAIVELNGDAIVSVHTHVCPMRVPMKELKSQSYHWEIPLVPVLELDASAIEPRVYTYEDPAVCQDQRVQMLLNSLTDAEMADIVVGAGMFGGDHFFKLPGSVGNTTSKFWNRGLCNVTLCDGPAGLRIQKRSTVSKSGRIKAVDAALSIFDAFPDFVKKFTNGDPEKEPVLYQYTTAFPVSHALAQTWNRELMYEIGTAIYREMKEYGCTYWLAPAVNIHRNPLCGRNFEYWSEDPFLAGDLAAAMTRGVQQEEGFYVTVKHFACNNQEDNRNFVSSNVSERALREIYLRAFQRCVQQGGAKGIMTSYNKVNGVYAPNSHDLCTKILRNEWGFEGVVMTDWFSTNDGQASNPLAIKAGNDLIMPGTPAAKKAILKGLQENQISPRDLRRCCGNVIRSILNSDLQREYFG
ncbi:MAG: glycoside hydrolase family 3 C-terminal domain-containing protein [Oscillospiraceae bacterium]|nr:glycoside hydrolase family 3 C-terminal domain-containing protein [Oscillospiraceae bacterium]MBR2890160.1 glycoside hydrolase family 3 C-terminal domain-containing protein [Oscillospiraceae bacterium]